jgi:hypothetical protein
MRASCAKEVSGGNSEEENMLYFQLARPSLYCAQNSIKLHN